MIALARRLQNQLLEFRIPYFLRACHHSMSKNFVWIYSFLGKMSTLISYLSNAMKASQPILPYCIYPAMLWCKVTYQVTDYGHPERVFFRKSQTFGVFSADLSAPILVLWVPCFPLINHYFYKKLSIYTQIPNIFLGLGFEFGPQRIRDLAIMCP